MFYDNMNPLFSILRNRGLQGAVGDQMGEIGNAGMHALSPPQKPQGLLGFDDPRTMGLLGAGLSLLKSSGPSPVKTTLGQAIGEAGLQGLGSYQGAQKTAIQNALANAELANKMKPKQFVVGNNLVSETGETTYAGKPNDPNIIMSLRAAGIDPNSPEGRRIIIENLTKPATQVNMGNAIPGKIADIANESRLAAQGAQEQLSTSNRIRGVLKSGGVVTGAGADWKISGLRIAAALNVGGKDDAEKLANTQNVIKGLAQLTLASRQSLRGQGQISDKESALLERAASGDVNLTTAEILTILDVNDRAANIKIRSHTQLVDRMKNHPDFQRGADFFAIGSGEQPVNNDPLGLRKK